MSKKYEKKKIHNLPTLDLGLLVLPNICDGNNNTGESDRDEANTEDDYNSDEDYDDDNDALDYDTEDN